MQRSIIWLRLLPVVGVAAAAVFFTGWKVVQRGNAARQSPFAMWDFRAGVQFQALDRSEPLGPITLVRNNLADSAEVRSTPASATALKSVQAGQVIEAGHATAPAAPVVAAPRCEPVALDLAVQSEARRRDRLQDEVVGVLRHAITRAYGGSRLVFGKDTELRDSAGQSDRISLGPGERDEGTAITVIAVQFPTRVTRAMDRLRDKIPAEFCRASAEVLVVRSAPNGDISEVHRISVGDAAVTSNINDIEAMISLATRRPLARAPLAFRHITEETTMNKPAAIVMTKRLPGSIEHATLKSHDWGFKTRTVVVPISVAGVLEGDHVLRRLVLDAPNGLAKP
ncbi:MAG: hypothetical protein ACT4P6_00530 [Gemmatimonadaceae bacterium]